MPSLNTPSPSSKRLSSQRLLLCPHTAIPWNIFYFFLLQSVNLFQFLGIAEESRDLDDQLSSTFGLRDDDDSSSLREFVGDQAMSTRTQILVLGLAVGFLHGCAHFPMTLVRSLPPPVIPPQENPGDSLSAESLSFVAQEATAAGLGQPPDVQDEKTLAPVTIDASSKSTEEVTPKPHQREAGLAVGLLHGCAHFPMTLVRSVPPPVEPTHENQADNLVFPTVTSPSSMRR